MSFREKYTVIRKHCHLYCQVVVQELNRLGILVDLSHAAHETVLAVLETTRSPVIFSHSSAQALCNTSRNVPDHILRLVVSKSKPVS